MSDEPNPNNYPTEAADDWAMPEPTFRSSEGYTPGRGRGETTTDEMKVSGAGPSDEVAAAITEEMPGLAEKTPDGSSSFLVIIAIIAVIAALIAAYYLLFSPALSSPN